jgi:hypothetical protein
MFVARKLGSEMLKCPHFQLDRCRLKHHVTVDIPAAWEIWGVGCPRSKGPEIMEACNEIVIDGVSPRPGGQGGAL